MLHCSLPSAKHLLRRVTPSCAATFRSGRIGGPAPRFPAMPSAIAQACATQLQCCESSVAGRVFLGGHSYGGRQATMLCAAEPDLVSGLLLLSYPLHPPRKPEQLRIQHLPNLRTPSLFVQGTRDPFGSVEEMERALKLIPAKTELLKVEGAGHDLGFKGKTRSDELPAQSGRQFHRNVLDRKRMKEIFSALSACLR